MKALSLAALVGTIVHHAYERRQGLGLPLQPQLGARGSELAWAVGITGAALLTLRQKKSPILVALTAAQLATVVVHYANWPTTFRRGIPWLTQAEGLPPESLPVYNVILSSWGAIAAAALVVETPRRRSSLAAAVVGLATFFPARATARHHFEWLAIRTEK